MRERKCVCAHAHALGTSDNGRGTAENREPGGRGVYRRCLSWPSPGRESCCSLGYEEGAGARGRGRDGAAHSGAVHSSLGEPEASSGSAPSAGCSKQSRLTLKPTLGSPVLCWGAGIRTQVPVLEQQALLAAESPARWPWHPQAAPLGTWLSHLRHTPALSSPETAPPLTSQSSLHPFPPSTSPSPATPPP